MSFLPTGALRTTTLLVTLLALSSTSALGIWPHDPTVNVPISTQPAAQQHPSICADAGGGAIVVWEDQRFLAGTGVDLFMQRIDPNGIPLWTAGGVQIVGAAGNQIQPAIKPDASGGAIFIWRDNNTDLKAQRVSSTGLALWAPSGGVTVCNLGPVQQYYDLASDGAGGIIAVWSDRRAGTGQDDIYAQRLDASGTALWTGNGVAVCTAAQAQSFPRIVEDGIGGAILVWQDGRVAGSSDIYAQRLDASGVPKWAANGVAVCTAPNLQDTPMICRDGAGGAIVTWTDSRTGVASSIYAQHLNINGNGWTIDGVLLSDPSTMSSEPRLVEDGSGGAIVAWGKEVDGGLSSDIYAQHVGASGTPLWAPGGVVVTAAPELQSTPILLADGAGGAIVAWSDDRTDRTGSSTNIYAQHLNGTGARLWQANDAPVTTASRTQPFSNLRANMITDGAGGAILTWTDGRSGVANDVYAQRIDRFGYLGAEPVIVRVRDVPDDQGGRVKLSWNASSIEGDPSNVVAYYNIFRSVPPNMAAKAFASGVRRWTAWEPGDAAGIHVVDAVEATYYWEYAGRQDAYSLQNYSWVAATTNDQTLTTNPYTAFMVQARNSTGTQFWNSAPDSTYSVDNIGPSLLIILSAVYDGGATALRWLPSAAPDFDEYHIYRGSSPGFPVSEATFVVAVADTGCVDAAGRPYYYKVTAVDIHGNESVPALAASAATVDIAGWDGESRIESVSPNPMTAECSIRFALRSRARVRLSIYDVRGRRVRRLVAESRDRGSYETIWDGRDDHGRPVPSAPYFYRLGVGPRELTGRIVVLR